MATESDNVNTMVLGTIVAVGTLVTVSVVFGVTALVRNEEQAAVITKGTTANLRPYRDLKAKQEAVLNADAAWVDRTRGVVSVPIGRAMELVVSDVRRDPTMATPWHGPEPTGADAGQAPEPGPTEAQAASSSPSQAPPAQQSASPEPPSAPTSSD